jgi:hypothetical protein
MRPRDIYLLHMKNEPPAASDAGRPSSKAVALSKITPEAVRNALSSRHLLDQFAPLLDTTRPLSRYSIRGLRRHSLRAKMTGVMAGLFAVTA